MQCPNCGTENQTGKFCAECGAALDGSCRACGADVPAGATYCTACGEPLDADSGTGGARSMAPWVIAGGAIVTVLLVLFLPRGTDRVPTPPAQTGAPLTAPGGQTGGMGGLSSDMRTNADRLFNRIMTAAEQGNQAEVDQFMPMAIQAHDMVEGLDADGLYHLALLHLTAGDPAAARAAADRILAASPDHILALGVAAAAEEAAGDSAAARELWSRLLEAYPAEAGKTLREYRDHQTMLAEYQRLAREATGGS